MKMRVIDVSKHNGTIDFDRVYRDGISGVIIRAGYGKSTDQRDPLFEENYRKAREAGLHVGAYWYSYAKTAAEAKVEAACFYAIINNKTFDLPVYLDIEEAGSAPNANAIIEAFCEYMEKLGYFVGLYGSKSYLTSNTKEATTSKYTAWVAQWANECTYTRQYDMWQYTDSGNVDGVSGNVDISVCYRDFPGIIVPLGKNGYDKEAEPEANTHTITVLIDGVEVYRKELT